MKVCLFTRSYSLVLDKLAIIIGTNDLLVVDFSTDDTLKNACKNMGINHILFTAWLYIKKELIGFDLLISYKLNVIIPMDIVDIFRFGGINIHPSLLPKYRGLNPWFQIYYNMDLESGVTIHKITENVDSGNIIAHRHFSIEPGQQLPLAMNNADITAANLITEVITNNMFLDIGKEQDKISSDCVISLKMIKNIPLKRLWHILRGFPSLIFNLFPELPHKYFEVNGYKSCSTNNTKMNFVKFDGKDWIIVCKDGTMSLCDFSKFPMIKDYINAIANHKFLNERFQNVEFELDKCGDFLYTFGSEAVVFSAKFDGDKFAIRFPRNITSDQTVDYISRLSSISFYLKQNNISNFVNFEVVPHAIELSQGIFPAIIMKWCNGDSLMTYIRNNIHNTQTLKSLLHKFIEICEINHNFNIVHIDIHSNNIIINEEECITLLDIDAIRICPFEQIKDVGGNKNWQHPLRMKNKYINNMVSYFSEIMVCATIYVAIYSPTLLGRYSDNESLFKQKDYISPKSSSLLIDLKQNEQCNLLGDLIMDICCLKSLDQIPAIETISIFKI